MSIAIAVLVCTYQIVSICVSGRIAEFDQLVILGEFYGSALPQTFRMNVPVPKVVSVLEKIFIFILFSISLQSQYYTKPVQCTCSFFPKHTLAMTRAYILFFQLRCSKMIITRAFRSFIEMKNEEREENTNFILLFSNGFLLQKKKKKKMER